ncbi:MAG: hypothetical protein UY64_C0043G0007 [Parcubacteria group bacterium GW2011_GWA1_51_12]|nr:MAG: hypothetical protein UY64_C0043G0007 [Parcubacteria group bacterium GW2011_GWA1_51_12]
MKYIFIDSNQYRHIYSASEGFSKEVYDLLLRLSDQEHIQLLIPKQTKDEVERNRWRGWPEAEEKDINTKIERIDREIQEFSKRYAEYKNSEKLLSEFTKKKNVLLKEKTKISKKFLSLKSKQNQKISNLFSRAKLLEETAEVLSRADHRSRKGNPPYEKAGKLGDALIWESLLEYLRPYKADKPKLIFVSNDKPAWGDNFFDPWLQNEFKQLTGGKILYSKRLSDIPELTSEEQEKIRKEEEKNLKENAIADFIDSKSFMNAGGNAQRLLKYENLFSSSDYRKLIEGAIANHEIYQSFFTPIPLKQLVEGEGGFVKRELEDLPNEIWRKFEEKFTTGLLRQSDVQFMQSPEINPDDIPF